MNMTINRFAKPVANAQFSSPLAGYNMQCEWRRRIVRSPKQ
ncbi:MAG: hypothetical protein VX066_05365 [Pseudomonadota bacterium]|nr:hypothetical protein [Marisediminitalea aggregata]MEC7825747.1 hypothetical protein [Pseudomonadota bacterium]MEC8228125.1 hypothetical protein [Pseudomonadota bacterium]